MNHAGTHLKPFRGFGCFFITLNFPTFSFNRVFVLFRGKCRKIICIIIWAACFPLDLTCPENWAVYSRKMLQRRENEVRVTGPSAGEVVAADHLYEFLTLPPRNKYVYFKMLIVFSFYYLKSGIDNLIFFDIELPLQVVLFNPSPKCWKVIYYFLKYLSSFRAFCILMPGPNAWTNRIPDNHNPRTLVQLTCTFNS